MGGGRGDGTPTWGGARAEGKASWREDAAAPLIGGTERRPPTPWTPTPGAAPACRSAAAWACSPSTSRRRPCPSTLHRNTKKLRGVACFHTVDLSGRPAPRRRRRAQKWRHSSAGRRRQSQQDQQVEVRRPEEKQTKKTIIVTFRK